MVSLIGSTVMQISGFLGVHLAENAWGWIRNTVNRVKISNFINSPFGDLGNTRP